MATKPFIYFRSAAILAFTLAPETSHGCGECIFGQTWDILPPIVSWSIISVVWFQCLALLASREETELLLIPSPSTSLGLVLVGSLFGFLLFGWLTMIPFLFPCILNFALSLSKPVPPSWSSACRRGVRWTGGIGVAAMSFFLVYDSRTATGMDEADKILMWEGSALSQKVFTELKNKEPGSLEMYRKIMREGEGNFLWMTAKRLQEIGVPEIEVPILLEAYKSDRSEDEYGMEREFIEKALRELTGLDLPDKTPPDEWERLWERKLFKKPD